MSIIFLTLYVLIWPVIVGVTLWVIVRAFYRDWREAKREGRSMI